MTPGPGVGPWPGAPARGLASLEASLATNLLGATPTAHANPCSSCTRDRSSSAIRRPSVVPCRTPVTSRNASSSESGSTSGVTERRIAMIWALTAA